MDVCMPEIPYLYVFNCQFPDWNSGSQAGQLYTKPARYLCVTKLYSAAKGEFCGVNSHNFF